MPWQSIGSVAGNLIGGLFGRGSSQQANRVNERLSSEQMNMQRDFAQQGIRWRVNDAVKAGIHPLYALGAQLPTYSPSFAAMQPDSSMPGALANMGQDIGRAIDKTRTQEERDHAAQTRALQLERMQLENEVLKGQIRKINTPQGPAMQGAPGRYFITGQGDTNKGRGNLVNVVPQDVTATLPTHRGAEPGLNPDVSVIKTVDGGRVFVPGKEIKERIEEIPMAGWQWWFRNTPFFSGRDDFRRYLEKPKPGYSWIYFPITGDWKQVKDKVPKSRPPFVPKPLSRSGYGEYRR